MPLKRAAERIAFRLSEGAGAFMPLKRAAEGFAFRRGQLKSQHEGHGLYRLRKNSIKVLCNKGTALAGPIWSIE
jgi:hypothetical protein